MARYHVSNTLLEYRGRVAPPRIVDINSDPRWFLTYFGIFFFIGIGLPAISSCFENRQQANSFLLFCGLIIGTLIIGYYFYNSSRLKFRASKSTESLEWFNMKGEPDLTYYFKDIKHFSIYNEIELYYSRDRQGNDHTITERRLWVLEAVTTIDSSRIIAVGKEAEITPLAKELSAFIDRPLVEKR